MISAVSNAIPTFNTKVPQITAKFQDWLLCVWDGHKIPQTIRSQKIPINEKKRKRFLIVHAKSLTNTPTPLRSRGLLAHSFPDGAT
jgi:hypothetical protein